MNRLIEQVQDLPQLFFEEIYDLTFSPDSKAHQVEVNSSYKPPALLLVNRATRAKFAKHYYSYVSFLVGPEDYGKKWLASLPEEHREMIRELRCDSNWQIDRYTGKELGSDDFVWRFAKTRDQIRFHLAGLVGRNQIFMKSPYSAGGVEKWISNPMELRPRNYSPVVPAANDESLDSEYDVASDLE